MNDTYITAIVIYIRSENGLSTAASKQVDLLCLSHAPACFKPMPPNGILIAYLQSDGLVGETADRVIAAYEALAKFESDIRVGVSQGGVIGILDSSNRFSFGPFGDTVNIAMKRAIE